MTSVNHPARQSLQLLPAGAVFSTADCSAFFDRGGWGRFDMCMAELSHGGGAGDWGGSRARPIPNKHYAAAAVGAILQDGLADSHSRKAARSVGKSIAPAVGARIGASAIVRALQAPLIFSIVALDLQ